MMRHRQRWPLKAAAALLLVIAAGWLYWRHLARATAPAAPSSAIAVAGVSPASTPTQQPAAAGAYAASAPSSTASVLGLPPPRAPLPPEDTPAGLLQKVQKGLGNSSPQEALRAAQALSNCASLARASEKLAEAGLQGHNAQDLRYRLPPEQDKLFESMGAFTKDSAEHAEREQRRCQVFDAAMLARRGELYKRAYEGDPQSAAKPYLLYLTFEGAQDKADPQLLASLRADARQAAESGDIAGLAGWAFGGDTMAEKLGFSLVEARAYREAYYRILDDGLSGNSAGSREWAAKLAQMGPPSASLTAEQQREVDALAQRILEASRRRWRQPTGR